MDELLIETPQIGVEDATDASPMDAEPSSIGKDPNFTNSEADSASPEPHEGMEFGSEESARAFYAAYARRAGFRVRISRYTRSRRDNSVISRLIVCSKEGFREPRRGERLQQQRQRAVTRVGCKAMLMVKKLAPGRWVVSKFEKEHNHGPVPPRKVEVRVEVPRAREEEDSAERPNFSSDCGGGRGEGEVHEPFEGMEFDSEEDARSFYVNYARRTGFRARISKYCRSRRDNSIISRQIVCSKEGFREVRIKKEMDSGRVKRPRVVTRIGCKAMIVVKKLGGNGKWVVSRFEREHNHALLVSKNVMLCLAQTSNDDCKKSSLVTYDVEGTNLDSNEGVATDSGCCGGIQGTSRESLTVLYNKLCYEAIKYAQEGAVSEEIYNVAMSALEEAVEKVAAAKRSAPTVCQRLDFGQCSSEFKEVIPGKELVLMQQPVRFVLIPSASLVNDSMPAANIVDSPMILNMHNGQEKKISTPVSGLAHLSPAGESVDGLVSSGISEHDNAVQNIQKLDNVSVSLAKATPGSGSNLCSPKISEAKMVAVPALPVTLYMPVVGSLSESSSGTVTIPGTPGNNTCTPIAAPVEALSISGNSTTELRSQSQASLQHPAPAEHQYTSPNPQVHATAIAAGARIVPPQEAASLIKVIEARVRTAKSALASGCKQVATIDNWSPQPCNSTDGQKAPAMAQAHGDISEGLGAASSDKGMQLDSPVEGLKKIEVGVMSDSISNDISCDDHHMFSDGGPGTAGSNTCTLVAAPAEALSVSCNPTAEVRSQSQASLQHPAPGEHQYTSPNPQVHATAIAVGARVIPPQEAVSLIKAIEARVRTAKSALAPAMAQVHGDVSEGLGLTISDEGMQLFSPVEGLNKIEVDVMSDSIANGISCDDHHMFSDGGS